MVDITDSSSIDLSLTNIWRSWRAFRKGKKPSRDITRFENNLENNLLKLCLALNSGSYQHSGYNHRIVNEKKRRDISVADVQDRVVHRLLYDYLVSVVDSHLDFDVWSCRKGKGLHACLERTASLMQRHSSGHFWRTDIIKFFDNVDHDVLKRCLARRITDEKLLNLLDKVVDSYSLQLGASKQASKQASKAYLLAI